MKVYLNAEGAIVQVTPSHIARGSTITDFEVEAPFYSPSIYVRFTLRKGTTDPLVLSKISAVSSPGLSVWSAKIPFAVTEYSGTVPYTIEIVDGGGETIVARGTLTVSPGSVPTVPSTPDEDTWKQITNLLSRIYGKSVYMRVSDGYLQFSEDGVSWSNLMPTSDLQGPKGDPGDDGQPGQDGINGKDGADGKDGTGIASVTAEETSDSGGYNTITFALTDGTTKTVRVKNGNDGKNGTGDSSVWVGSSAPANDSYVFWIDTSVTATAKYKNPSTGEWAVLSAQGAGESGVTVITETNYDVMNTDGIVLETKMTRDEILAAMQGGIVLKVLDADNGEWSICTLFNADEDGSYLLFQNTNTSYVRQIGISVDIDGTMTTNNVSIREIPEFITLRQKIIDAVYPVGAIYISYTSATPSTLFGGTWVQIQGQFLLASSSSYAAGSTGGEATHTLTADEMPSHYHATQFFSSKDTWKGSAKAAVMNANWTRPTSYSTDNVSTESAGGGAAHNNMPPYLAVYMWRRTA